jgi:hypothetical protein
LAVDGSQCVDVEADEAIPLGDGGRQAAYDAGLRLAAEAQRQGASQLLTVQAQTTRQSGS